MNDGRWFAVYTRPRWEKKVTAQLKKRNIVSYTPLNSKSSSGRNNKGAFELTPLFSSYIFVYLCGEAYTTITQIPGVVNFMYWHNEPAVINNEEIETIKHFLNEYQDITVEKTAVRFGDMVHIEDGSLMRRNGSILEIRNTTVKAALPTLGHTLIAKIRKESIESFTYSQKDKLKA